MRPPEGGVFLGRSTDLPVPGRGTFSIARRFGSRQIGYADLSGRLPEGVGQGAF